jgi:DNA-binding MarR family transcriptional regulator
MTQSLKIRTLINRIGRIDAADGWSDDLNPTQLAALGYLAQANRFSRAPSHVADFLGTTRGTMSQTLKALERKGYISELRSDADKRYTSYDLTAKGRTATRRPNPLEEALQTSDPAMTDSLEHALTTLLQMMLKANKGRAFGQCIDCIHFKTGTPKAYCDLLSVSLEPPEIKHICHEQVPKLVS